MDKTVLMLIGPSGCGKSTLERGLCESPMCKKVVSTTTRERREGEVDGEDYHFVTPQVHQRKLMQGDYIQTTEFAGNSYGSERTEYTTLHPYCTLCVVPTSAKYLIERFADEYPEIDVKVIYFDISKERLIANMKARGDTDEMIEKRLASDDLAEQMESSGLTPHLTIRDATLNEHTLMSVQAWLAFNKAED